MKNKNKVLIESSADDTDILVNEIQLIESIEEGKKYKCAIIKAGITKTANAVEMIQGRQVRIKKEYPEAMLKEAFDNRLFEGVPFLIRDESEHLQNKPAEMEKVAGYFTETYWDSATATGYGTLNLREGSTFAESIKTKLKDIWQKTKHVGLSIVAHGKWAVNKIKDEYVATVESISHVTSVDPCRMGNAGGKVISLIESAIEENNNFKNQNNKDMLNDKQRTALFAYLVKEKKITSDKKITDFSDDELLGMVSTKEFAEITKSENPSKTAEQIKAEADEKLKKDNEAKAKAEADAKAKAEADANKTEAEKEAAKVMETQKKIVEEARQIVNQTKATNLVTSSKLPQVAKDKIIARLSKDNFDSFNEETLKQELADQMEVIAECVPNFLDINAGGAGNVKMKQAAEDKMQLAMDWLVFSNSIKSKLSAEEMKTFKEAGVTDLYSFKRLYEELTGDAQVTGKYSSKVMAEAIITSTYAQLLGNTIHRATLKAFANSSYQADWRRLVTIVPRSDYKENTLIYRGGYNNLPTVSEDAAYTPSTTPAEQAVKYTLSKRGYTESVTREAILNDDLGTIQRIPMAFGEAAARTLYEFVFNLIITNPTMLYDTTALFHANHNNLGSAALDATSLAAGRFAMRTQTDLTNGKRLAIRPKFLLIPEELAKTAYDLTTPSYGQNNGVPQFYQTWQLEPLIIAHATDANNWFMTADPATDSTIEIAFLNGRENPEIFIQDEPTNGTVFTHDKITYKIRHEYNGAVANHRGFYGAIVT